MRNEPSHPIRDRAHLGGRAVHAASLAALLLAAAPVASANASAKSGPQRVTDAETEEADEVATGPITAALRSVDDDVRIYNDHLTILASPWMEGRLPGTRGMELAKEYIEHYYAEAGLERPYTGADGAPTYRQPFELGTTTIAKSVDLRYAKSPVKVGDTQAKRTEIKFAHGEKEAFTFTGLGKGVRIDADVAFVGYGIEEGPKDSGFTSYADDLDLEGKVAVMLRYEPMDEEGKSQWGRRGRWSARAQFRNKLEAAATRGASAIIIVNTPGAADPRAKTLLAPGSRTRPLVDVPVLHMSSEAGEGLVRLATDGEATLAELTAHANKGPVLGAFGGHLTMDADLDSTVSMAENLVGRLPGRGALANEVIVVGAHFDHLGMGEFGSRDREFRGKALHPGADDNASGTAGILHIARKMAADYAALPADAPLRTVLFIGFSAEESGLNGSEHYVDNPLGSLESHVLMMNFDMIGRMKGSRLALSGVDTADGLKEFIEPIVAANPLDVHQNDRSSGGSDHRSFFDKGVPVLFAIIKDFHADYHTSRDVSYLINRVEAVQAAELFRHIATAYAQHDGRFAFKPDENETPTSDAPATARLGVRPDYGFEGGVRVAGVGDESGAQAAGLQAGDIILTWNGKELKSARAMSELLRGPEPGDVVKLGIRRGEQTLDLEVTLGKPVRR
ncbi:MAG: M28 family peptidase [Planctomycetota bacterium]